MSHKYRIGVYGTRNLCTRVSNTGFAVSSFVSDMSSGFSGNLGFPLPRNWAFDQILEERNINGSGFDLDKVAFSGRDEGFNTLASNGPAGEIDLSKFLSPRNGYLFFNNKGLKIDADGSPRAYGPNDSGIDNLANAGYPGNWWALEVDENGNPKFNDQGYYISMTSLRYKGKTGQEQYVDAENIPYIVIPEETPSYGQKGDISLVINTKNKKYAFAITADIGPKVGEGSIKLVQMLGVESNPRSGGTTDGITYIIFPNSGDAWAKPVEEINTLGEQLIKPFLEQDNFWRSLYEF